LRDFNADRCFTRDHGRSNGEEEESAPVPPAAAAPAAAAAVWAGAGSGGEARSLFAGGADEKSSLAGVV